MMNQYFSNLFLEVSLKVLSLELKITLYTNLDFFSLDILFQRFGYVTIKYFMDFMLLK